MIQGEPTTRGALEVVSIRRLTHVAECVDDSTANGWRAWGDLGDWRRHAVGWRTEADEPLARRLDPGGSVDAEAVGAQERAEAANQLGRVVADAGLLAIENHAVDQNAHTRPLSRGRNRFLRGDHSTMREEECIR